MKNYHKMGKNENFEKQKKMSLFLMSQGSLIPKMRFLGQKAFSVARITIKWVKITIKWVKIKI